MALIQCFECGAQVSDLAKSCPRCGAPVRESCKCMECGNIVSINAIFCPQCGTLLKNGKPQQQRNNLYIKNASYQQYASSQNVNYGGLNGPDFYGQAEFSSRPHLTQYESSKLTFGEAVSECFRKYATFSGRARRSEYWFFYLFNLLINISINCFLGIFLADGDELAIGIIAIISILYSLSVFLPGLAVYVRRMHDIGKSGANIFWVLLPIVGWIMLFVWLLQDSEEYENEYGPSPKYN